MPVVGINVAFSAAKKVLGARLDPYSAYNFLVEIDGIIAGGFTDVSGLSIEINFTEPRRFGGENNIEYKFITGVKYTDITLKHGLTDLDVLWNWYEDVINGKIDRKNGSIYLLDHSGIPAMWWDFYEAYPIKWEGPAFNASGNAVATETLVLTHKGLTKPKSSQIVSALRGVASAAGIL